MPTSVKSTPAANNSNGSATARKRVKKFPYFFGESKTIRIFVLGKRTVQSTQDISYPQYSGVSGAVPFFGTVRLPKHKGTSLPFYVHIK